MNAISTTLTSGNKSIELTLEQRMVIDLALTLFVLGLGEWKPGMRELAPCLARQVDDAITIQKIILGR